MSSLHVPIACDCGHETIGHQGNAGTDVACRCGKTTKIPRLSLLRQMAGSEAYATNPADRIRSAVAKGESPGSVGCLVCGTRDATVYACRAVCESSYAHNAPRSGGVDVGATFAKIAMLLISPWFLIFFRSGGGNPEEEADIRGHDVSVDFQIAVCNPCKMIEGDPVRPKVLKKLLKRVNAYRELLEFYPEASVEVVSVNE